MGNPRRDPGLALRKILKRADGTEARLPSKCDEVVVKPGDMLVYRTAGGGGWKDPLDRAAELVEADVAKDLISADKAKNEYGVVVGETAATEALRNKIRAERDGVKDFDMGPPLEKILANCEAETGLPAPVLQEPLPWAKMESSEDALRRVREQDKR